MDGRFRTGREEPTEKAVRHRVRRRNYPVTCQWCAVFGQGVITLTDPPSSFLDHSHRLEALLQE